MKPIMKNYLSILLLCVLTPLLSACGGSDDTPESPNFHRGHERRYTVNLALGGDFVEQSDSPLTRADGDAASPKTYVAVHVRTKKLSTDNWQYYAYGVFDDPSKMQLEMTAGYYYDFEATTLTNSTDVFQIETSGKEHQMDRPFICDNENGVSEVPFNADNMNKFIYSTAQNKVSFTHITSGTAQVKTPGTTTPQKYRYPRVLRYYGKKTGFIFTSDLQGVVIPVDKKNFGIQIKTIGLPEGTSLSWSHINAATSSGTDGNSELQFSKKSFTGSSIEEQSWEDIYSLYYLDKDATNDFKIEFTWQRTPAVSEKHTISFVPKANVMKVLKIDFTKQAGASGVNISISMPEEDEMTLDEDDEGYSWQ